MRKPPKREMRKLEQDRGYGRSATYNYIRANLEDFTRVGIGVSGGPSWEAFAATLAREGLTNKHGGPLAAASARRIFRRVSDDVRAETVPKDSKPSPSVMPSRLPATWRPTQASPSPAPRLMVAQPSSDGSGIVNCEKPSPEKALADLRRILAERSGR